MEAKNVIVNERTIKGYIELHKVYNEPLSDGKMGEILLKKIFPLYGVGGLVAAGLALSALPLQVVFIPVIASTLVGVGVMQHEEVKEKNEVISKYPYLDPTLSCEDLEDILVDSEAIVYDDECFYHYDENVLDRKKYVEKCEVVLKEVTSSHKNYSVPNYDDIPKVEIPKVKKLGTIQDERKRISK